MADHDESLDVEIAAAQAEADVRIAEIRGRHQAGQGTGKAKRREGDDGEDSRSWDEFWSEIERAEAAKRGDSATTTIRGVEVAVPHDLPLKFDRRLALVEQSEDEADVHALIVDLFGVDAFEAWVDAGMKSLEFRTVLLWGIAHGKGRKITFAEAFEAVETEGKALKPNRSERRASGKAGGASKRTSKENTGSRRRRSRT